MARLKEEKKMLQDSLNLMEHRVKALNRSMESIVCVRIRKEYPDLVKSYRNKEITYQQLLDIYNQLVWGDFDIDKKFSYNKEGES